ncbi:MAG: restriction endonuclease [Nitrospirae bacterium]|nr:restriction endonuclease [Nitrospirota bacterium]
MKYAYEDLSSEQFEELVVAICQKLLGIGVQSFSKGPDGGRDAMFQGTANCFPSETVHWKGKVIIQAKHTNGYNKTFSGADFRKIIEEELPRIKELRDNNELDYYMLFSNRRLSGDINTEIRRNLSKVSNVAEESIYLCGVEQINIFLKRFPEIVKIAKIDPVDSPLIVSPDDLADIINALDKNSDTVNSVLDAPPTQRVDYKTKNRLNDMSQDYAKEQKKRYLKETNTIANFLAAPENLELLKQYNSVVEEFQNKIIANRRDYQTFDEIIEYLIDLLFGRDPDLRKNKRLTRAVLFYMYWNCDIGKTEDVETN